MAQYDVANEYGVWQDDEIWSLGAPPSAAQDAYISGPTDFKVTSIDNVTVNSVGVANGDQLEISYDTSLTAADGTVLGADDQGNTYGIDGLVYVDADATFSVGDAILNFGTVFLGGAGLRRPAAVMRLNGAVAFTGSGDIDIGGGTTGAWWSGDIFGDGLINYGQTFEGAGLISLTSFDNAVGKIIAEQIGALKLTISAATIGNEATMEIGQLATMEFGADGATESMTNTGTISVGYYQGFVNSGAEATLAISGNFTVNGDGKIIFGGDDASIVGDGSTGDTFTNGSASSIHANFRGEIGNGAAVAAIDNLTFDNYGSVYASGDGVTLTINTGANTVYDSGGLLEADDSGMLIIDSSTQMGVYYFLLAGQDTSPAGGTIEATGGGTVEIASAVANGPPSSRFDRESSGQVVVGESSVVIIASGGDVAVPVIIETGGILEYSAGGEVTGSITFEGSDAEFEFGQSNVQSGEISGYRSDDTISVNGFDIDYQPADPHQALPTAFTLSLAGDVLTQTNADGSTQVTSYDITGQSFTQKAIDTNADGEVVAKYFSGVTGEDDLSAFEYLYAGNNLVGTNEWYSNITGQAYTNEEVDYNGAGEVTRLAFSGLSGTSYSSYEYDYVGGVFSGSEFSYPYGGFGSHESYEVDYDHNNTFTGEKFFFPYMMGQSFTGEEEDFNANSQLSRVVLTGVENQAYSSIELDYNAGIYTGYKAYYDITGQAYTNEEVDASTSGQVEKAIYSGLTGTPYETVEQDYSGGAPADVIYGYTDVTGQTYNAYQVMEDASGDPLQETFDLNSGGHTLVALASGQTLTSLGEDKMAGDGATTFVLDAIYGADTIANLQSDDTVVVSQSEFENFSALQDAALKSGANILITAADGDTLTLKNMTLSTLAGLSNNFTFNP